MKKEDILKYLRDSVNVQTAGSAELDENYLAMTDEDLERFISVCMTRDFPKVISLEYLPNEDVYPLMLLVKKELYYALAVKNATAVDMVADNNNQLKRNQRYSNYLKLIAQINDEYKQYNDDGGAGTRNTLTSFNVTLPNRYGTRYNYEHGVVPALSLFIDRVTNEVIKFHWELSVSRFSRVELYVSKDSMLERILYENVSPSDEAHLATVSDIHQTASMISGLEEGVTYYILVELYDLNGNVDRQEACVTTEIPTMYEFKA